MAANIAKSTKEKRPKSEAERDDKPRKLKWKEERELEGMEEAILNAETEAAEIEAKLNDPGFYIENSVAAIDLAKELDGRKREIQALYDRWEELEAIRSAGES